jgi:hypothetical protein
VGIGCLLREKRVAGFCDTHALSQRLCIASRETLPAGKIFGRFLLVLFPASNKISVGLELALTTTQGLVFLLSRGKISHEGSEKQEWRPHLWEGPACDRCQGLVVEDVFPRRLTNVTDSQDDPHLEARQRLALLHRSREARGGGGENP